MWKQREWKEKQAGRYNQRWRGGCKEREGEMRDIKIQTVDVTEIKKIVETERQITRSKRTERGGLNCHMTELLGRPEPHLEAT